MQYCKRSVISRLIGKIDSVDNRSCEGQKDWKNVGFPTGVVVRGTITPGFWTLVTFTLLVLLKKNKNKINNFRTMGVMYFDQLHMLFASRNYHFWCLNIYLDKINKKMEKMYKKTKAGSTSLQVLPLNAGRLQRKNNFSRSYIKVFYVLMQL